MKNAKSDVSESVTKWVLYIKASIFYEPKAKLKFNFKLILKEETIAKIKNVSLTFYTPLNINLTEKLFENLYESNQSWSLVN